MSKFNLQKNSWISFEMLLILFTITVFPFIILCLMTGMKIAEIFFG